MKLFIIYANLKYVETDKHLYNIKIVVHIFSASSQGVLIIKFNM